MTKFIWNEEDIVIREDDGLTQRLKKVINNAPSDSKLKGEYYLAQLADKKISQKELNLILVRGF